MENWSNIAKILFTCTVDAIFEGSLTNESDKKETRGRKREKEKENQSRKAIIATKIGCGQMINIISVEMVMVLSHLMNEMCQWKEYFSMIDIETKFIIFRSSLLASVPFSLLSVRYAMVFIINILDWNFPLAYSICLKIVNQCFV